jgi:hypothetical protein
MAVTPAEGSDKNKMSTIRAALSTRKFVIADNLRSNGHLASASKQAVQLFDNAL